MISFTIVTSTPVVVRDRLVAQGIITLQTVEGVANTPVAVREGLEWLQVPNPIKASGTGTIPDPYIADTRKCYLVKMARAQEGDEIAGEPVTDVNGVERPLAVRTKFGKWVMANSTADTLVSADGRSWPARKVGATLWLVASSDFGVWQ